MRHFISNIVSAMFLKKSVRDKVRVMIRYPQTRDYIRLVRRFAGNNKHIKIKTMVGYGSSNLIVILNDKHVFKFPLRDDGKEVSMREKRIVDAFYGISPIKIPLLKIIPYKNIYIRKYEFARGTLLTDVSPDVVVKHKDYIAKQIAEFLYVIAKNDPVEIRDLKQNPQEKPGYLVGWNHGDIWQNFMLDEKNCNITFFIDWEAANFGSLKPALASASYHWEKFKYRRLIVEVMSQYSELYFKENQGK